jgi:hypothetical protein
MLNKVVRHIYKIYLFVFLVHWASKLAKRANMSRKQIFCKQTLNMFGKWEAKLVGGGWLSLRRWVAKFRGMGGQVDSAPACYGSSLGSNPDISQKFKIGAT